MKLPIKFHSYSFSGFGLTKMIQSGGINIDYKPFKKVQLLYFEFSVLILTHGQINNLLTESYFCSPMILLKCKNV